MGLFSAFAFAWCTGVVQSQEPRAAPLDCADDARDEDGSCRAAPDNRADEDRPASLLFSTLVDVLATRAPRAERPNCGAWLDADFEYAMQLSAPTPGDYVEVLDTDPLGERVLELVDPTGGVRCSYSSDRLGLPPIAGDYVIRVGTVNGTRDSTGWGALPRFIRFTVLRGRDASVTVGRTTVEMESERGAIEAREAIHWGDVLASGETGGPREASELQEDCAGYIARAPSFVWNVRHEQEGTLRVYAEGDATLAVQYPNGEFVCVDDAVDLDPAIAATFAAGRYRIYVGEYSSGSRSPYELRFQPVDARPVTP